jgi:hypothetical protein
MARKQIVIKEGTITIGGTTIQADPDGKVALSEILAALTAGGGNVNIDLPGGGAPGGDLPMGGAIPDVGSPLPPAEEAEPHFPGETPEEHAEHEASETPEEEAAEHAGGESEAEEKDEKGPPSPPKPPKAGGEEKEEEGEEEEGEEEESEEKGNPFAESRDPKAIANLITEDIRVNNGVVFSE